MGNKQNEFKLAFQIAISRKTPIVVVVPGCVLAFEYVKKADISNADPALLNVRGRLEAPDTSVLAPELDHWVTLDLEQVSAVIIRDLTSLEYDNDDQPST